MGLYASDDHGRYCSSFGLRPDADVVLQAAVKEVQISEEIGDALSKIATELGRWERVLQLFPDSQRLHTAAAELFAQVINYLVRASRYFGMGHAGERIDRPRGSLQDLLIQI